MQKLSKLMLAAVAAIALATPAMAWDFSASGSVSAQFNMKSIKDSKADNVTTNTRTFASSSGAISLKSAHTDGDKSLTLTYKLDVDTDGDAGTSAGLDETFTLAASDKLGDWTASATATQHKLVDGAHHASTGGHGDAVTADPTAAITLTNGNLTYVLGDSTHLARPSKAAAVGAVGGNQDAQMNGGSHNGFSLGIKLNDSLTLTPAVDMNTSASCFGGTAQPTTSTASTQATCLGINVDGSAGVFGYSVSVGSGSSSDDNSTQGSTGASSVLGVGLSFTFGTSTIAVDIATETVTGKATKSATENKATDTETEFSYKLTIGDDSSFTVNLSTDSNNAAAHTAGTNPTNKTGLEVGYSTKVGPVTLEAGYGSNSTTDADASGSDGTGGDGESDSDIGVKMSWSF